MTHVSGHMPDESCEWKEKDSDKCDKIHGYLYVSNKNGKHDPSLKVFLFNNDPNMPYKKPSLRPLPRGVRRKASALNKATNKRKVGFHLTVVGAPDKKDQYIAVAHDVVLWKDHENTESCVQGIARYKKCKIEDIPPIELTTLAIKLSYNVNDADTREFNVVFKKKYAAADRKKKKKELIKIIGQSVAHLNSETFRIMSGSPSPQTFIKTKLWPFKDISKAMGKYGTIG